MFADIQFVQLPGECVKLSTVCCAGVLCCERALEPDNRMNDAYG